MGTNWQWFSVQLVFESIISGEPDTTLLDKNYTNDSKTYEESLILVNAESFDHAYKIAVKKAKEMEINYTNPYGELVNWQFVEAIDCFSINEETLITGVELYSRHLRVPKNITTKDFIDNYYPDTIDDNCGVDYNFILRNKDFNSKPNSRD